MSKHMASGRTEQTAIKYRKAVTYWILQGRGSPLARMRTWWRVAQVLLRPATKATVLIPMPIVAVRRRRRPGMPPVAVAWGRRRGTRGR
eukprot:scaffold59213_cov36-Phaeocystis_antarctica.AAC.2